MKIRVGLYDQDVRYVDKLVNYFNVHYSDSLEMHTFSKIDAILEQIKKRRLDLLLIDPDCVEESFSVPQSVGMAYLSESAGIDTIRGKKTICKETGKKHEELGCGEVKFTLKAGSRRGTKSLKVEIGPKLTTDYEIIPHHFDSDANKAEIAAFIKKYIFKPCKLGENKVGVELNFNKEFYVPEKLDSVEDILAEIKALDAVLKEVNL